MGECPKAARLMCRVGEAVEGREGGPGRTRTKKPSAFVGNIYFS